MSSKFNIGKIAIFTLLLVSGISHAFSIFPVLLKSPKWEGKRIGDTTKDDTSSVEIRGLNVNPSGESAKDLTEKLIKGIHDRYNVKLNPSAFSISYFDSYYDASSKKIQGLQTWRHVDSKWGIIPVSDQYVIYGGGNIIGAEGDPNFFTKNEGWPFIRVTISPDFAE